LGLKELNQIRIKDRAFEYHFDFVFASREAKRNETERNQTAASLRADGGNAT
jgi:hypothetical protein